MDIGHNIILLLMYTRVYTLYYKSVVPAVFIIKCFDRIYKAISQHFATYNEIRPTTYLPFTNKAVFRIFSGRVIKLFVKKTLKDSYSFYRWVLIILHLEIYYLKKTSQWVWTSWTLMINLFYCLIKIFS